MQESPWGFKQFPDRQLLLPDFRLLNIELDDRLMSLADQEDALRFLAGLGNLNARFDLELVLAEQDEIVELYSQNVILAENQKTGSKLTLIELDTTPDGIRGVFDFLARRVVALRFYAQTRVEEIRFVFGDEDDSLKNATGFGAFVNLQGGNDIYKGNFEFDDVFGGDGNDRLNGKAGDDILDGAGGNDKLTGGDGLDLLGGFAGNDRLNGNNGDDFLDGGAGKDKLKGGDGDDWLVGGEGRDKVNGGAGNDVFYLVDGKGFDIIQDFTKGEDEIQFEITNLGVTVENNLGDAWIFQGDDLLAKVLGAGDTLEIGSEIIV